MGFIFPDHIELVGVSSSRLRSEFTMGDRVSLGVRNIGVVPVTVTAGVEDARAPCLPAEPLG